MIKFFNTFTRKKEAFKPIKKNIVGMYTCGPTVYDYAHIGNLRTYIFEDLLRRYLKYKGYKVKQVMNLTDVDDKTIKKSQENNLSLDEYTKKYKTAFFEDLKILNIEKAEIYPEATKHIRQMIALIQKLLNKNYAYLANDNSIYYNIKKFKDYGKLAHINLSNLKAGARVKQDEYEKQQVNDFALWKSYDKSDGNVFWDAEFNINGKKQTIRGRPGWHIECSAMSMAYLGETFDIHTGGIDNIFPHHENEIAQSEAATNKKFVNYWIHDEHLIVDGKKMSKSLGNFFTLRDLLQKKYSPRAIRYLFLSTNYRKKLNFTFKSLEAAQNSIDTLDNFVQLQTNDKMGSNIKKLIKSAKEKFENSLDDDLNISKVLAVIFDFIKEINKLKLNSRNVKEVKALIKKFDSVLGLNLKEKKLQLTEDIKKLIKQREKARKEKNFKTADKIRNDLLKKGIILEDTHEGVIIKNE